MSHICSAPETPSAYAFAMDFPANLEREMSRAGMNQSDLARALGISPSAVNMRRRHAGVCHPRDTNCRRWTPLCAMCLSSEPRRVSGAWR